MHKMIYTLVNITVTLHVIYEHDKKMSQKYISLTLFC